MWAKLLNCSIVSVEYSLAPENPFPRPTEEVLYAYAYIINNAAQLGLYLLFANFRSYSVTWLKELFAGWTGEKICMIGDSAGGNLIMSVSLKLVQLGVKRIPDGIVTIYTPFLFQVTYWNQYLMLWQWVFTYSFFTQINLRVSLWQFLKLAGMMERVKFKWEINLKFVVPHLLLSTREF